MSLLPGRILPADTPIGKADENGSVTIDKNWWLFLYNIAAQVLGTTGQGLSSTSLQQLQASDDDSIDSDAIVLRAQIAALANQIQIENDPAPSLQDVRNALILAQDVLLPDPVVPTPGLEQTIAYALNWVPATNAQIALTFPTSPANNWIPMKVWVCPKSGTQSGSGASYYLSVWTGSGQTGTNLCYNGTGNTQANFQSANIPNGKATDIGFYLANILNDAGNGSSAQWAQPIIPAASGLYASVTGTGWSAAWTVDVYVQGMVLPFGP